MKLSAHFDSSEFICKCGCGKSNISNELVQKLEQLYSLMGAAAIIVNSGCRCPAHSVSVGGGKTDAHTRGIAADIAVRKQNGGYYTGEDIAEAAERIGFTGIGIMSNACHVDIRNSANYVNSHWFGNEITGDNWIKTFQRGTVFPGEKPSKSLIADLQRALNTEGAGLAVDGICGEKTLTAARKQHIDNGSAGEVVRWLQNYLNSLGYNCGIADGICGKNTMSGINAWQKAQGVGVGYFGGSDWDVLLRTA